MFFSDENLAFCAKLFGSSTSPRKVYFWLNFQTKIFPSIFSLICIFSKLRRADVNRHSNPVLSNLKRI